METSQVSGFERTIVVVYEGTNPALMALFIFAEGQGFSYQIWASLSQGVVEPLDVRGLPGFFAHRTVPLTG